MRRVEQGTTTTLTGLAAGVAYNIAVQVVTSNSLSPYSQDKTVMTTASLQATDLEEFTNSLDLPTLTTSVTNLQTKTTDLRTEVADLQTATNDNKSNFHYQLTTELKPQ